MAATSRRLFSFHPILFGLYSILALLAINVDQIRLQTAVRAVLIVLAGSLVLYGLLFLILRKPGRAALLTSFWLILFYAYGHVYQVIEGKSWLGIVYGKHRYLVFIWLVLFVFGSWWILKKLKSARPPNQILNLVSVFLILFPLYQLGVFAYRFQQGSVGAPAAVQAAGGSSPAAVADTPDIYYIIMDGYSRADVQRELYQLDIQPFMRELESIGFVFPNCAQSNYGITAFSMFASLNMNYLDTYEGAFPLGSDRAKVDYLAMRDYLRHSLVRQYLHQRGYQMVTFETGYWWLEVDDADTYIVANNNPLEKYSASYQVSNFEEMFIRTTALRPLAEANTAFLAPLTKKVRTPREHHYDVVRFALDELAKVPEIPGKKFVYFHILAPHDPFVFDPDGNYVAQDHNTDDIPGYPNEVTYLNKRLVQLVRTLIASSKTPPIIILQGDHGWDPRYRMQILNAYYLPNGGDRLVYPTITPVNTFRLILNHYFGENLPLLKDASFYSMGADFPQYGVLSRPYQLTPVPATCMAAP